MGSSWSVTDFAYCDSWISGLARQAEGRNRNNETAFDSDRKEWDALDMSLLPNEITKEKLLTAAKDGKLGTRPKAWRDLTVDGETLEINLSK